MQINDAVFLTQAIYEKLQPLRSPRIAGYGHRRRSVPLRGSRTGVQDTGGGGDGLRHVQITRRTGRCS